MHGELQQFKHCRNCRAWACPAKRAAGAGRMSLRHEQDLQTRGVDFCHFRKIEAADVVLRTKLLQKIVVQLVGRVNGHFSFDVQNIGRRYE